MQLPPHCKCYWHRLSLSRLAAFIGPVSATAISPIKRGTSYKKEACRAPFFASAPPLSRFCRLLQFKAQFNKHLCVQINYSTWRRVRCALSESGAILFRQRFCFCYEIVDEQQQTAKCMAISLSLSLALSLCLSISKCVCAKQTTSAKFVPGAKSLLFSFFFPFRANIHIYEWFH